MRSRNRNARINIKVVVILVLVIVSLGISLVAARQVRRTILSAQALTGGNAAFEKEDWPEASKQFQEYLGRNPDDVEILKKYAKARLSIRPIQGSNIMQAIAAYRRIVQLKPADEDAYEELFEVYSVTGHFEELAHIARNRIEDGPNDRKARLKLAEALFGLNKTKEAQEELEKLIKDLEALLPDKYIEDYVRACRLISQIILADVTTEDEKALTWLNKAVFYAPESVEALACRAQLCRIISQIPGQSAQDVQDNMDRARRDLEHADNLGTDNPRIRLFLAEEWIAHDELDRAEAELQATEGLTREELEEYYFDVYDWATERFVLTSRLAGLQGATIKAASLVDNALEELEEVRHRVRILPLGIMIYVDAHRVSDANECLDEYMDAVYTQQAKSLDKQSMAYLQAIVAAGYNNPYGVINALQPFVSSGVSTPKVWRLLSDAFIRTDQTRRAIHAIMKYLRIRPQDPEMTLQLAKEYLKLQDWNKAFEIARLAEPLDPTDIVLKLLRIEASINISTGQVVDKEPNLQALEKELTQLRTAHPDRVDIRILQAIVALHLNKPEEAEKELKRAIEDCEEPLRAEMQLVRFYRREKRMDEAISAGQGSCESHPEVAEPWLALSSLHVANTDYDLARNCLIKAQESVVKRWEKRSISMSLALLELMHGDRNVGIDLLSDMAAQDKNEIRARTLLLTTREIRENQERAQELVDELREAEGKTGLQWRLHQVNLWLASDSWRTRQQDITSLLQYCIDLDPQSSAPVLLMANMYEKLNDSGRVDEICRQGLARNPSAMDVAEILVNTLERQGRLSEATNVLEQSEADSQLTSAVNIRTALRKGDFSKAIEELEVRVSNDDQDADSLILLARLIYQRNSADVDQALAYLDQAEAIASGSLSLKVARISILKAEGQEEKARRILDDYVVDSKAFGAYMMRAVFLANEGEFERAEQDYRKLTTFAEQQGARGYELLSNFYARNQQYDKAILVLKEGLNAYPENLTLKRRLMKTLFVRAQAQDTQEALEILAELEKRLPRDPELMQLRAIQLLGESTPESLKAARDKLVDVIKLEPTAADAHLKLIRIAMQEGQFETARNYAIRALGSNPKNSTLLSARGRVELALENTLMAAEMAKLALQEDSNNTEAREVFVTAAMNSNNRGFLEQALTLVGSRLSYGPTDEQLLILRVGIMARLDRLQIAIRDLKAYCQTGGASVAALVTLADLYRLSGDFDQAESWIEEAEQIDPNGQMALHARFMWLIAQERYNKLEDISSAYISAKEQNPEIILRAALVLTGLDSMTLRKEALKLVEHVVTLLPTSKDAQLVLATILYQTGNVGRAKKVYEELLQQDPKNLQVLNGLAWILQEYDRSYEAALELASKGLRIAPSETHLLDTRGTILLKMDRLADAKRDFRRIVDLTFDDAPRQAKALLKLGRICAKLNDLDRAKQHLQEALEIDQKNEVFTADERSEIVGIIDQSGV